MTDQLQTMPVKIMRVSDWIRLLDAISTDNPFITWSELQSNYEHLIHQPLKKGDFVNEVEKPDAYPSPENSFAQFNEKFAAFESAQSALVFDGFEEKKRGTLTLNDGVVSIFIGEAYSSIEFNKGHRIIEFDHTPTSYDLIYHISKYNETATNKINLTFTKEFLKKVIS